MAQDESGKPAIDVLAYYFPQFHRDGRNDAWHGKGWSEWELLRAGLPRYEGHQQPKRPAWGEFDESDPAWSTRQIDLAADHGLTGFIFDWYWYEQRPFLEGALERGFLKAANRERLKFALMWANHDWLHIFPAAPGASRRLLAGGAVNRAEFDQIADYVISRYFRASNYLRVDGGLYFSIYELSTLIKGLGGLESTKAALDSLRHKVRKAGLGNMHLNAVVWGVTVLPSENKLADPAAVVRELGFSSLTTYAWVHHYPPETHGFPRSSYAEAARASYAAWDGYARAFEIPYHPNVSVGWDPTPRTQQGVDYQNYGYPWTAVLDGNTPAAFEGALRAAKRFALQRQSQVVTINAWNEWTEGSYLLPDLLNGTAYLQAIANVFQNSPHGCEDSW